jgi:hypothetical protein
MKTMATYNNPPYDKGTIMLIYLCVGISIAIADMASYGWLPGGAA